MVNNNPTNCAMLNRLLLAICTLLLTTSCIQATWQGCTFDDSTDDVARLKDTPICLVVSGGNFTAGTSYKRWLFTPKADEYTHFKIPNSFQQIVVDGNDYQPEVSVHVQSFQVLSQLRRFYDQATAQVFPYLTAIIDVDKGEVVNISWDDACLFCDESDCKQNTYLVDGTAVMSSEINSKGCAVSAAECAKDSEKCDLTVYVVWTGTDSNGKLLDSVNGRFGAFGGSTIRDQFGI